MTDLSRLLRPKTVAVLGGSWARSVVEQCQGMGYSGEIWPVHPTHDEVAGLRCYASVTDLPSAPDATFIGINRFLTIEAVNELSMMGAGGAVCFASGYEEAAKEDKDAAALHQQLLSAAGSMPLIGPNCYGLINYLDGALLWPDQHGGQRVDSGVAFITQSSNIAINLTMQQRALPISYILTAGNQAQLSLGQLGTAIVEDQRVTALALHIEGFGDIAAFEAMAARAKELGKPIIAIKVGQSEQAQQAMVSHTNSLSGRDSAASAFLHRLGIARVYSLPAMIETLKLLHVHGPLMGSNVHSMSCSGGEASLMSDAAVNRAVEYPALNKTQMSELRDALGPLVALSNPLDYHTFIWDNEAAMTDTFSAMLRGRADLSLLVLDFPRADRCDYPSWYKALNALKTARDTTGTAAGVIASLPENMPESIATELIASKLVPLCGIDDGLIAIETARYLGTAMAKPVAAPTLALADAHGTIKVLQESQAKQQLRACGLQIPAFKVADSVDALPTAVASLQFPVALKGTGLSHKTEADAVRLNLDSVDAVLQAADKMLGKVNGFLVEEFIGDTIAELLVSITRDSTHGYQLTLASGGILTELVADTAHLLLPFDREDVQDCLQNLKIAKLLAGYRGQRAANLNAVLDNIMALQSFALANTDELIEVEINPLLCTAENAWVADALISIREET